MDIEITTTDKIELLIRGFCEEVTLEDNGGKREKMPIAQRMATLPFASWFFSTTKDSKVINIRSYNLMKPSSELLAIFDKLLLKAAKNLKMQSEPMVLLLTGSKPLRQVKLLSRMLLKPLFKMLKQQSDFLKGSRHPAQIQVFVTRSMRLFHQ